MTSKTEAADVHIGIVGLGFMGSSIVASLLAVGHKVIAVAPLPGEKEDGQNRIQEQLRLCEKFGILYQPAEQYLNNLTVTYDYRELKNCSLVVECIIEDLNIKKQVFSIIAEVTGADAILASNTSAIPISILQRHIPGPERFIGIHWAEPAFATRFLEIICGEKTSQDTADAIIALAGLWGKEPTLLRKDIRGFITNRLMYAVYREELSLIERGHATIDDVDKALRYDAGSWITLMGIFRRMDYMGLKDYAETLKCAFPQLNNRDTVPELMKKIVEAEARGTKSAGGFYKYTKEEAKKWEEAFALFNFEIFRLAAQYPSDKISKKESGISISSAGR